MNAERRSPTSKSGYDKKFPYHVDLLMPPEGFGQRLNLMTNWCLTNVPQMDQWAQHGWMERPGNGKIPRDWARFYFMDEDLAAAFRRQWGA